MKARRETGFGLVSDKSRSPSGSYRVADLTIDFGQRRVWRGDTEIELPKLSFDLFAAMVSAAPDSLSIDELMDRVWAGAVVSHGTIAKRVELLRDAFGDDSQNPRYIALVRGFGYRLIPAVEATGPTAAGPRNRGRRRRVAVTVAIALALVAAISILLHNVPDREPPPVTTVSRIPPSSIAVLGFVDLSPAGDQTYFAQGISEELINLLSRIDGLNVAARTSAFMFQDRDVDVTQIGQALGVAAVLEGSVRRDGDRVRITAQLISTRDGYHLWSDSFDRDLGDVFGVQSDIAHSIVDVLELELLEVERTFDVRPTPGIEAYDLYLLGRHHMHLRTRESLSKAIELFERVIDLDSGYAPAWSGLAIALSLMEEYVGSDDPYQIRQRVLSAARQAVELDPKLAEAHASLALSLWQDDPDRVEAALQTAVELNPGYSMAHMWLGEILRTRLGRPQDALERYRRAAELDPLHPTVQGNVAEALLALGKPQEAELHLLHAVEYSPESVILNRNLSVAAERQARLAASHYWANRCVTANPNSPYALLGMGMSELLLGRIEEAERWHGRLLELAPDFAMADFMQAWILFGARRYSELDRFSSQRVPWMRPTAKLLIDEPAETIALLEQADWDRFVVGPKSVLYSQLGYAYRQLDRADESTQAAQEGLTWLEDYVESGFGQPWIPYERAMLLALLDREDAAVDSLNEAYVLGWREYFRYGTWIPLLDDMIGRNPRYVEFKEKLLGDIARMREQVEGTGYSAPNSRL